MSPWSRGFNGTFPITRSFHRNDHNGTVPLDQLIAEYGRALSVPLAWVVFFLSFTNNLVNHNPCPGWIVAQAPEARLPSVLAYMSALHEASGATRLFRIITSETNERESQQREIFLYSAASTPFVAFSFPEIERPKGL